MADDLEAREQVRDVVVAMRIVAADGIQCCGADTKLDGITPFPVGRAATVRCAIERLDLVEGRYFVDVAVKASDGSVYHENHRTTLTITSSRRDIGVFRFPHQWTVTDAAGVTRGVS